MLTLILLGCAALVIGFASGCGGNRTVFIPEASPMRVGPSSAMRVYTLQGGEWVLSANRVDVPEGWYLVSPSWVAESDTLPQVGR